MGKVAKAEGAIDGESAREQSKDVEVVCGRDSREDKDERDYVGWSKFMRRD